MSCACKGIRTCLTCEDKKKDLLKSYAEDIKDEYVYCFLCKCAWKDEDLNKVLQVHPNHQGDRLIINGVHIIPEFITESEERELVKNIDDISWIPSQSGRRKQDFGPKVNFKKRKVKIGNFSGFPSFVSFLIARLQTVQVLSDFIPVELCNLEYVPERGSSIDSHLDDSWLWGERLITINLLSDAILTLSPVFNSNNCNETQNTICRCLVYVPLYRRSLIVLSEDARHTWYHGIFRKHVNLRRLAMTFRELSRDFLPGGREEKIGQELLNCVKYENDNTYIIS